MISQALLPKLREYQFRNAAISLDEFTNFSLLAKSLKDVDYQDVALCIINVVVQLRDAP